MRETAKVTSKGQVTLPKRVRDALGVSKGDAIDFVAEGDRIVVRPRKSLSDAAGMLSRPSEDTQPADAFGAAALEDDERIRREYAAWNAKR